MKVSVIMAAYNRDYIIAEALQSVFAQKFADFELIVIDDGSRDRTWEVVKGYNDPRLRCIRKQRNRGYSAACNTGMRKARGEYLAFLDSDDVWKPEKLLKDVDFLERHPEVDAVFTDLEKVDGSQTFPSFMRLSPCMDELLARKQGNKEISFAQPEIYNCLLREVPIKPSALVMRRKAVASLDLFNESWPSGSDWEFLIRFSKQFRFGYIDEPLTILRVQPDATHRQHAVADKRHVLEMLRAESRRAATPESRRAAIHGYRDTVRHLSWEYLKRGERRSAAVVLARGFGVTGDVGLLARAAFALVRRNRQELKGESVGRLRCSGTARVKFQS